LKKGPFSEGVQEGKTRREWGRGPPHGISSSGKNLCQKNKAFFRNRATYLFLRLFGHFFGHRGGVFGADVI